MMPSHLLYRVCDQEKAKLAETRQVRHQGAADLFSERIFVPYPCYLRMAHEIPEEPDPKC